MTVSIADALKLISQEGIICHYLARDSKHCVFFFYLAKPSALWEMSELDKGNALSYATAKQFINHLLIDLLWYFQLHAF